MKSTDGYVRDLNNKGAVLNVDKAALEAYKAKKAKAAEIDLMKKEVKTVKQDVAEIKEMLKLLLAQKQ